MRWLGLRTCLHIGRGKFDQAALVLDHAAQVVGDNPEQRLTFAQYRAWLRARPYLVRLRALLALCWHQTGAPHWERDTRAVLRETWRHGYRHLLVRREPDLGAQFWALCVAKGIEVERAARALGVMGREEAIPALVGALIAETEPQAQRTIGAALGPLEQTAPHRSKSR